MVAVQRPVSGVMCIGSVAAGVVVCIGSVVVMGVMHIRAVMAAGVMDVDGLYYEYHFRLLFPASR